MNFDYSVDQLQLKDEARRFLSDASSMASVRQVFDDSNKSFDIDLWSSVADLGWLGAIIPEEQGGLALGATELCALSEELGRAIAPIPFSSTIYLFTQLLLHLGTSQQRDWLLPEVAKGSLIGCVASSEGPGNPKLKARVQGGKLSGVKLPVTDGDIADYAIVSALDDAGTSLYLIDLKSPEVNRTVLTTIDPSRSAAEITFNNVAVDPLGPPGEGVAMLKHIFDQAAIYTAFEQIGGADKVLEMTRDYALKRYAFGRAIGSFQAVKHKMANMYVRNQIARSNAYFGAWALEAGNHEVPKAAAAARIAATEAFQFSTKEAIEIFGGIGTTWEADCHLFYRRAKQLSLMLGPIAEWREQLAAELEISLDVNT